MRPYDRSTDLPRAIPLWPHEINDASPTGRRHIISKLEAAASADHKRGASGHWTYDLSRHRNICRTLKCERAELAAIEGSMMIRFTRTFPTYRAATLWLHERGYSAAVTFIAHTDKCTITIEGESAKRAIEEETGAKVVEEAA